MRLYIGSYTNESRPAGIHLVQLDPRSGALRLLDSFDAGANPSYLALHPGGRTLYATNETEAHEGRPTGAVTALAIAAGSGTLTPLNRQPSGGGAPCFLVPSHDGRVLLVANHAGGTVARLPIRDDGSLAPAAQVVQHAGHGPHPERQRGPHPHCIALDPTGRFALVADLGIDRVLVYALDHDRDRLRRIQGAEAVMHPGAGPRHLAFHPALPLVYVANELDSTIATLRFDPTSGRLALLTSQPTLDGAWSGTNQPAAIGVSANGRTLYVSNRGHDSIAVFTIAPDTGALALEQTVPCGGAWPRDLALDSTECWLLVANQQSDSVAVFARDAATGLLTPTRERLEVAAPACVRFAGPA